MDHRNFRIAARGEREIVMTRSFDAPPGLVFEAWTRPELLRQWYGCEGSSLRVCEIDLRLGGQWRFVLRMADGSEHPFHGRYRDIEPGNGWSTANATTCPAWGARSG